MKRLTLIIVVCTLIGASLFAFLARKPDGTASLLVEFGGEPAAGAVRDSSINALAEDDPLAVLDRILTIEDPVLRRGSIGEVAAVWAASDDPTEVLDAIRAIPDTQAREALLAAVLSTWSVEDVVGMFRYIASVDDWDLSQPGSQGLETLRFGYTIGWDVDYRALAALIGDLPPPFDRRLRRGVMEGLARQDSAAAIELFETLPADERTRAAFSIVNGWAVSDPRAAFAWARTSAEPRVALQALTVMSESDPLGAIDLALQQEETPYLPDVTVTAMETVFRDEVLAPNAIADALVTLPESAHREQVLERMAKVWAGHEPERMLEWLLAHGELDAPALFTAVAANLRNPALAASYAERVPSLARNEWIQKTADLFASRDPNGAAEWIEQFRHEPAYASSVAVIASFMARNGDGPGAVELLRHGSLENNASAVSGVVVPMVRSDPEATIDWIQTLTNDAVRKSTLSGAARIWVGRSPDEAERWVLTLPSDEERDAILYSMISGAFVREAEPSESLLRAFSNDYARQVAAVNAARELESYKELAARRLLDRYVTDPDLRQRFDSGDVLPPPN